MGRNQSRIREFSTRPRVTLDISTTKYLFFDKVWQFWSKTRYWTLRIFFYALLLLLLCQVLSNKSSILTSRKLKVGLPGALCLVMIKTLQTWEGSSSVESCWSKWRQIDFVLNSRHQGWRKWREERDKGHWAVRVVWGGGHSPVTARPGLQTKCIFYHLDGFAHYHINYLLGDSAGEFWNIFW